MKRTRGRIGMTLGLSAFLTLLACPGIGRAQYVISARAGVINYTQGEVLSRTSTGLTWEKVTRQDQLDNGDHLRTGVTGRAEILLTPGSVLRLDRRSELVLVETDLPTVEMELLSGSAILEAGELDKQITLRVKTPHTSLRIKDDGLYRIDVTPRLTRVTTRKGELEVLAGGRIVKVKKGATAEIQNAALEVTKGTLPTDDFDLWAQDRAETMLAANLSLTRRRSFTEGAFLRTSSWVYDPVFGFFTYVPFGYFYRSPWGRTFIYCPWGFYWWNYPYGGGYSGGGPVAGGWRERVPSAPSGTPPKTKLDLRVDTDRLNRGEGRRLRPPVLGDGGRIPADDGFGRWRGVDIQSPPPGGAPAAGHVTPLPGGPILSGPKAKGRTSQ